MRRAEQARHLVSAKTRWPFRPEDDVGAGLLIGDFGEQPLFEGFAAPLRGQAAQGLGTHIPKPIELAVVGAGPLKRGHQHLVLYRRR